MSKLEEALAARLKAREEKSQLRRLTTFPADNVDFSSNAYLSLSLVPEIRSAYHSLLEKHASPPPLLGSGGSRLLDGNSTLAESLERDIAAFHNAQAGLLFNSGFDANVGLVSCLPQPGNIIVYDELIHASAHDGMKLSRAGKKIPFKHNCIEGEGGLDEVLKGLADESVFILVEGVYSMDGDVAPLQDIVACVKQRLNNGYIIVDEAHSTGLYGKQGRGLVCELGLEKEIFARLHTFGKAMSSFGAIVLCSPTTREYLINYARTLIYTTAMPFPCLASIGLSYQFLASGKADALLKHLWQLVNHTHKLLQSSTLGVNRDAPKSPIIPVFTSQPRSLAQFCQERGYTVRPIVAPTVPKGSERIRICIHAGNTMKQVEGLVKTIKDWEQNLEGKSRL
ncbi:Aminotran-1-2 domain-containing protein [Fusarium keratoplasticum]|uniref:Aminotran-1-2 domain-containing protein n=1 Tax=Fusarium keratoplasticum TaxID=1328300 RepID=A0ACC0QLI9_9HYPO|nr:Aminotran-1-2 domain-containing protein [Fusarium keratoplasticum]KAI8660119.1 Aminotran-1-2 domain-containing protein [Fusarium keratoplasticum]